MSPTPVRRVVANLSVTDPAVDTPFWTGLLGLETAMDQGWVVNHRAADVTMPVQVQLVSRDATAPVEAAVSVDVGTPETVDELHARAVADGLRVEHPPTDEPWGVRRFFVRTPGGVVVNVVAHR
ncbi:VOC family protein [Actinomycetospora endophytica]|uniref:VOC family protein n=1 Tax=Actinomycetospora endophytica TaxID=2291215 RepID=A0ABS8P9A3_9PSEU|nr:VOC family protein [Actinomycetospora endophytica]MCD2194843.1 VOC family protein [Actinomycetospora endophytica]